MVVRVIVRLSPGRTSIIDLCDTEEQLKSITVLQLKREILEGDPRDPDRVRLIFRDECLEDSSLLSECGIQHKSTIYVAPHLPGEGGDPGKGDGGMGDKEAKNQSTERLVLS